MDFKQLNAFVRVAELGSFTRAASSLGCVQSALSRQVGLLEQDVGQPLLRRHGRGVVLTRSGELLLRSARDILSRVDATVAEVSHCNGVCAGRVHVAYPPSLSRRITVPLARGIRGRLPDAALSLKELESSCIEEKLRDDSLDIGIVLNARPAAGWVMEPLAEERLHLVTAGGGDDSPIALQDVAPLALVIGSQPDETRLLVEEAMRSIGCEPRIAVEIAGVPDALRLVAEGAGAAVLGGWSLPWVVDRVRVRPIVQPAILRRSTMMVRADRLATPTVRAACDVVVQVMADAGSAWIASA